jgi:hypothetical protein
MPRSVWSFSLGPTVSKPFRNSVLLMHRSEQQILVDSVIRAQSRTLVAADTVFRSGREADRSGGIPGVRNAGMSLAPDYKCAFLSCFAVNRCVKGFQ